MDSTPRLVTDPSIHGTVGGPTVAWVFIPDVSDRP